MNYAVFDTFLARETWHTNHDNDLWEFYRCLHQVIDDPEFNPDNMGKYIRAKKGVDTDTHVFAGAVRDLVSNAWAVHDYFAATKTI
jgi:hypothetical protein